MINPDCISIRTVGQIVWAKLLKRLGLTGIPPISQRGGNSAPRPFPCGLPTARFGGGTASPSSDGVIAFTVAATPIPSTLPIDVAEVTALTRAGEVPILLDVREECEFATDRPISGTVAIPMSKLNLASQVPGDPRTQVVVVIGGPDGRASSVAAWLVGIGRVTRVLQGGAPAARRLAVPEAV